MNELEEWRQIPDIPHEVSTLGRIRRTVSRTNSKAGTILKLHLGSAGYPYFNVTINGRRKTLKAHRLVAEAFLGPPPSPQHVVAHNDGVKSHNAVTNLRWATMKENHSDRRAHGTHPAGVQNPRSKLTDEKVRMIRSMYARGQGNTYQLADKFGVYVSTVQKLINRETWKHVL